jgi:aromatic ring-opening dioxygenase LigB subunit
MAATSLLPAFAGLLPHAPILIPAVAGAEQPRCRVSRDACREFARRLHAAAPDRLVLLSPHAPSCGSALGVHTGRWLRGDLGRFGAPHVAVSLPADVVFAEALLRAGRAAGIQVAALREGALDHGAVVPLWFLAEAGWHGPTAVLSPPVAGGRQLLMATGQLLASTAGEVGGGMALVASGDLTHRATPSAPAGFDARAVEFDLEMVALVRRGELAAIAAIDADLRELAAEDAADTTAIVAAAIGNRARGNEVLGYEHPFGVGYLVAVLHDGSKEES